MVSAAAPDEGRDWGPSARSLCDHARVTGRVEYRSWMSDNLRWDALELREGDIVISAPPKCGTTWTQRLVALLVFDGPDLPGPMSMVSPWLDQTTAPIEEVVAALDAQRHRRIIKTHTPLDGLVLDDRVTYIGVGRDPRDAAMSMIMDWDRMWALRDTVLAPTGQLPAGGPDAERVSPLEAFQEWIELPAMATVGGRPASLTPGSPEPRSDIWVTLATVLHHFGSVWNRRQLPNVAAFHYTNFQADLVGELVRLGQLLGCHVTRGRAEELAKHGTLDAMRARAPQLAPDAGHGISRSNDPFFRTGGRGSWRDVFTEAEHRRYSHRIAQLAPQDLLSWAHEGRIGQDQATGGQPHARHGERPDTRRDRRRSQSSKGRKWRLFSRSSPDPVSATRRVQYRSLMSDNLRWDALELREGDIVISAPSKCGMTWTQRLVSLLVFGGPDLPGPMSTLSPWLDQTVRPIEDVVATLDAQQHRRFIKTHTPLDGLVLDDRVTYIGVGRDPRDAAVSLVLQEANVDHSRIRALHQGPMPPHERFGTTSQVDPEVNAHEMFRDWMERPMMPPEGVGSLTTILHHLNTMWQRRHLPNVALFHYTDYQADLPGELARLGQVLGYDLGRNRAAELAEHATLHAMRARASQFAPNSTDGFWRNDEHFFRSGGLGEWRNIFTEIEQQRYTHRSAELAPRDLLHWANEGRRGCDPTR